MGKTSADHNHRGKTGDGGQPDREIVQSLISLVLFLHLFCVFILLSANLFPSALQWKLQRLFAPYAQLLNFDLNRTPFHLTHAALEDTDCRIEVLPVGADAKDPAQWHVLPDRGLLGSPRYQRYQRLARLLAFFALYEDDDRAALVARAVAVHFLQTEELRPAQVRCRRHMPISREAILQGTADQRNPDAESTFEEIYRANVIIDGDTVDVLKVESASQVARPAPETES